jgi:hypothetical protein
LSIPYAGEDPVFEITDTSCDDGSMPLCNLAPPQCDPASEILATQEECYRCVNPATCKPWGESACETDADCGDDGYCEPCGTSSCPTCVDCISVCIPWMVGVKLTSS